MVVAVVEVVVVVLVIVVVVGIFGGRRRPRPRRQFVVVLLVGVVGIVTKADLRSEEEIFSAVFHSHFPTCLPVIFAGLQASQ